VQQQEKNKKNRTTNAAHHCHLLVQARFVSRHNSEHYFTIAASVEIFTLFFTLAGVILLQQRR
jgi:hypothetical protein